MVGIGIVLGAPFVITWVVESKNEESYFSKYVSSATKVHVFIVALSVLTFAYMMANGILINGSGVYQVVPASE